MQQNDAQNGDIHVVQSASRICSLSPACAKRKIVPASNSFLEDNSAAMIDQESTCSSNNIQNGIHNVIKQNGVSKVRENGHARAHVSNRLSNRKRKLSPSTAEVVCEPLNTYIANCEPATSNNVSPASGSKVSPALSKNIYPAPSTNVSPAASNSFSLAPSKNVSPASENSESPSPQDAENCRIPKSADTPTANNDNCVGQETLPTYGPDPNLLHNSGGYHKPIPSTSFQTPYHPVHPPDRPPDHEIPLSNQLIPPHAFCPPCHDPPIVHPTYDPTVLHNPQLIPPYHHNYPLPPNVYSQPFPSSSIPQSQASIPYHKPLPFHNTTPYYIPAMRTPTPQEPDAPVERKTPLAPREDSDDVPIRVIDESNAKAPDPIGDKIPSPDDQFFYENVSFDTDPFDDDEDQAVLQLDAIEAPPLLIQEPHFRYPVEQQLGKQTPATKKGAEKLSHYLLSETSSSSEDLRPTAVVIYDQLVGSNDEHKLIGKIESEVDKRKIRAKNEAELLAKCAELRKKGALVEDIIKQLSQEVDYGPDGSTLETVRHEIRGAVKTFFTKHPYSSL
ncbi:hypothetical protein L596_007249 [Steinernema carpocapsae]|uniref:Uncharacterized protein n=1 Tax=Steinernema carpocapsae TaxID=34508 RepID=A0A4U5P9E9_STECR|nr:hypothetical protein L596_007249 [Steinernema carpocapsae]